MEKRRGLVRTFWGDILAMALFLVGAVLGVVVWFRVYRLHKVATRLPKLPTGIACGLVGGLIGFLLGVLLEDSINSL